MDLTNIIKPESRSVQSTFEHFFYRLPIYQRNYSWRIESINKLFETINRGFSDLSKSETGKTLPVFLGNLVLVVEDYHKLEQEFTERSMAIVDGQQRLTSLSIVMVEVYQLINNLIEKISKNDTDEALWIISESSKLAVLLQAITIKKFGNADNYIPIIVKEDRDNRGKSTLSSEFRSDIANYLLEISRTNTSFSKNYDITFARNINLIRTAINEIATDSNSSEFSIKFLSQKNYVELLPTVENKQKINMFINKINKDYEQDAEIKFLCRIVFYTYYILQRVFFTVSTVSNKYESLAFDIFESLNTTGEPLTAIQTLKPEVTEYFKNQQKNYNGSDEQMVFDNADKYLSAIDDANRVQEESKKLVHHFFYYTWGKFYPPVLSTQRIEIRRGYTNSLKSEIDKTNYIKSLDSIIEYKEKYWDEQTYNHKPLINTCLQFIRKTGTELSIPILSRYWKEVDALTFENAVKSITAFIVIWRAVTGGTADIDKDFRGLLAKISLFSQYNSEKQSVMSIPDLNQYLRDCLSQKLNIGDKKTWIQSASTTEIKMAISKFILLCAADNTQPRNDNPLLLVKKRSGDIKIMEHPDIWDKTLYKTIEHIAPQNISEESNWTSDIYYPIDITGYIGNLTLLPNKANASAGNRPWDVKKLLFSLYAAATREEFQEILRKIDNEGITIPKSARRYNYDEEYYGDIPLIRSVISAKTWDREKILKRGENLLDLAWDYVAPWLDLKK